MPTIQHASSLVQPNAVLLHVLLLAMRGHVLIAGAFRVLVLRKGPVVVTVATLRLFGTRLAEMPFVATKDGYRREGNCKRLMQVRAATAHHQQQHQCACHGHAACVPEPGGAHRAHYDSCGGLTADITACYSMQMTLHWLKLLASYF